MNGCLFATQNPEKRAEINMQNNNYANNNQDIFDEEAEEENK